MYSSDNNDELYPSHARLESGMALFGFAASLQWVCWKWHASRLECVIFRDARCPMTTADRQNFAMSSLVPSCPWRAKITCARRLPCESFLLDSHLPNDSTHLHTTRLQRSEASSRPPSSDFLWLILPRLCVLLPPSSLPRYVAMPCYALLSARSLSGCIAHRNSPPARSQSLDASMRLSLRGRFSRSCNNG
jgi:hypothetical protein